VSQPAGYSGTPLPRKLGIRQGDELALIGAPDGFADRLLGELQGQVQGELQGEVQGQVQGQVDGAVVLHTDLASDARYDVIVTFVSWRAELAAELGRLRAAMAPACGLWVAWPKRASRVPTDMTDQVIRDVALPTGLVDNKVCAIDQTWSGLRLVIRRENR
jgi:hypothetical protein